MEQNNQLARTLARMASTKAECESKLTLHFSTLNCAQQTRKFRRIKYSVYEQAWANAEKKIHNSKVLVAESVKEIFESRKKLVKILIFDQERIERNVKVRTANIDFLERSITTSKSAAEIIENSIKMLIQHVANVTELQTLAISRPPSEKKTAVELKILKELEMRNIKIVEHQKELADLKIVIREDEHELAVTRIVISYDQEKLVKAKLATEEGLEALASVFAAIQKAKAEVNVRLNWGEWSK
jgi:hypothetical protein